MPVLPDNPTLPVIQHYVRQMMSERGFADNPILQECLLLNEEVGELCKAVRKQEQLKTDKNSRIGSISEEVADILIVLSAIANYYHIDLETAFRDKEAINHQRTWQ